LFKELLDLSWKKVIKVTVVHENLKRKLIFQVSRIKLDFGFKKKSITKEKLSHKVFNCSL
jgi:hypothetical protein